MKDVNEAEEVSFGKKEGNLHYKGVCSKEKERKEEGKEVAVGWLRYVLTFVFVLAFSFFVIEIRDSRFETVQIDN